MQNNNSGFFPGLNGLRAIVALVVVVSHTTVSLDAFGLNSHILGMLPNGNPRGIELSEFAVSIFFSLTGFLITFWLLEEKQNQEIDIRNFYIRRILRIWPLYYLYFLAAYLAIYLWHVPHDLNHTFFYVFFMPNIPKILQAKSILLGHYWSLGIQEQFYLFWPWVIKKVGQRSLSGVTALLLTTLIVMKVIAHEVFPDTYFETAMYVNRFDCTFIGALGAQFYFQRNSWLIRLATNVVVQYTCWSIIFLAAINKYHVASIFDHEIMSCIAVALFIDQITARRTVMNLNLPVFNFLGRISFGIYIIHPMIVFLMAGVLARLTIPVKWLQYALAYAGVISITVFLAYLSYEHVEKWFIKQKRLFAPFQRSYLKSRHQNQ